MQARKKIRLSIVFSLLFLVSSGNLSAQIGVTLPPFENDHLSHPGSQFFELQDLQLNVAPYHLKTPYLQPRLMAPAFNSPLADQLLTSFGIINRLQLHARPFFCDIEFQMEKASGFPVKFRLGDVQYVNRLEGKIDFIAPRW